MVRGDRHARAVTTQRRALLLLLPLALPLLGGLASAESAKNPWGAFSHPAAGEPRAIGDYSGGCLQGARALALDGEGYQVMHPSRLRYFGHPTLLDFIETLGHGVAREGLGVVLIGDMSQPRGGRATGGHASHQTGLDVDIWFWHPKQAERAPLPSAERERVHARTILDAKAGGVLPAWKTHVAKVLELAARDARVERIFVHPLIKRELCTEAKGDRSWLRRIRPWYGHDDHFHVRLACPADSPSCTPQDPPAAGDGCEELDYWLSEAAQAERAQGQKRYQAKVVGRPKWPAQCDALLAQPDQ